MLLVTTLAIALIAAGLISRSLVKAQQVQDSKNNTNEVIENKSMTINDEKFYKVEPQAQLEIPDTPVTDKPKVTKDPVAKKSKETDKPKVTTKATEKTKKTLVSKPTKKTK
jgi:hypothetical protein